MNTHLKVVATLAGAIALFTLGVLAPKVFVAFLMVAFAVWLYGFLYVIFD
jgi:hypothetical protein